MLKLSIGDKKNLIEEIDRLDNLEDISCLNSADRFDKQNCQKDLRIILK